MRYQNEIIHYYSTHIDNIAQFIEINGARVIVFYRGKRHKGVFDHLGQVLYDKSIAEKAPFYQHIQTKEEKTSFTKAIVEKLNTDGFIFVQCDSQRDNQYFVYDIFNPTAFTMVRRKVSQAIRDFNLKHCSLDAIESDRDIQGPIPEEKKFAVGNEQLEQEIVNMNVQIPMNPPDTNDEMVEYNSIMMDENNWKFDIHDPDWDELFASNEEDLVNELIGTTMDIDINIGMMWDEEILEDLANM